MLTTMGTKQLQFFVLLPFLSACLVFAQQLDTARILLYTATADFRHDSIPTAIQALRNQSESGEFNVQFDATEDKTKFADDNLQNYDAIMFVSTTGEVLDDNGKNAFQNWLNKGGNFIGVHSASDTLRNTTFYGKELGAYFDYHPAIQNATVDVIGPLHPSTAMLPSEWHVQDEMYNFKSDPRSIGAVVILSANESSYVDTGTRNFNQGSPHPTAWYQERGAGVQSGGVAGRSFYTSLGHLNETWMNDIFMAHIMGGVMWALQSNTTRAFNVSAQVGNLNATASISGTPSASSTADSTTGSTATNSSSMGLLYPFTPAMSLLTAIVGGTLLAWAGVAV